MVDTETLSMSEDVNFKKNKDEQRDDLGKMTNDLFESINFKIAIFIFIFGVFIFSDLFIDKFLSNISGATHGDTSTTKGTMIQLLILVLFYLSVDLLNQGNVI